MSTIRFARLSFERKLSHYADQRDAIERRKAALRQVIDFSTNVDALLQGTDMAGKTRKGTLALLKSLTGDMFLEPC